MKSPFPGMDPYIEARGLFEDFHDDLISEIKRRLADALPARYVARMAERPYVVITQADGKDEHVFKPDVGVVATAPTASSNGGVVTAVGLATAESESVAVRPFITTEYRETFVEIYITEPERILVACIEVLSPANKRRGTEGWDLYQRKRQGLLLGSAHLVEIDLLRGGDRMPMLDPWPSSPYTILVSRRARSGCRAWPAHFTRSLPTIPVPLLSPDPDIPLALQPMVDAIYARSRYHLDIDYTQPLVPALSDEESRWLAEQIRQRSAPANR